MDDPAPVGTLRLSWSPDRRRLRLWFEPRGARVTTVEARAIIAAIAEAPVKPVQVVVDVSSDPEVTPEYREAVGTHFRAHPHEAVFALLHLNPVIGVMLRMFSLWTKVRTRGFDDEAKALAWLEEECAAQPLAR